MDYVELFHDVLKAAVESAASDIHIKTGTPIVFRINRQLYPADFPYPDAACIKAWLEHAVPAHLKRRLEEEREADFSYYAPGIGRFRTNVFQQRGEFCFAMRHVKTRVPSFEELGLPEILKEIAETQRGIVIVAGPSGCGKSTTLAAMIEHINANFKKHIITLEDPIEYLFEDNQSIIEQREIGLDTISYHHALKHVLRQDPDVIMIGEMRDSVSIEAAMAACDTGHLVLTTLHTINAPASVVRILDFFKAEEREQVRRQLAGSLRAIIVQRMVNTVSGGITPAFEILINTPTVRKLIEENRLEKLAAAIETGTEEGMMNFNQSLLQLVRSGKITEKEALAKAPNPQALEMNLKGIFLDDGRRILG
ncbi:MAG: PilT/PilU family type 4a pilus ATPase [Verrucomicrobiae bacterium]|nr:PilT/PilU family type 4a pilus ATPase [Verrucomicrobiae bacterium]